MAPLRPWQLPALLLATLASRLVFVGFSGLDMPAVLLVRGVEHFDPVHASPHLPGYAGLILLARALPLEPVLALKTISALASTLFVLGGVQVARRLQIAPLSVGLLLAANPVAWYFGVFPNTYAVGSAGAVCTAWAALAMRASPSPRRAVILGLALGATGALGPSLMVWLTPMAAYASGRYLLLTGAVAAAPTLGWIGWCASVSGGLMPYLEAIGQAAGRAAPEGETKLQHLHRVVLYVMSTVSVGALLLPGLRRGWRSLDAGDRRVLALWIGVPFAAHVLFHCELGYLLAYLPVFVLVGVAGLRWWPVARVAAAGCAALFVLARPMDAVQDARVLGASDEGSDLLSRELSFLARPSAKGALDPGRAASAIRFALRDELGAGQAVVLCEDRWNETIAEHVLPGVRAAYRDAPKLLVPAEGVRLIYVGWGEPEGFDVVPLRGHPLYVRDLKPDDLPFRFGGLEGVAVDP